MMSQQERLYGREMMEILEDPIYVITVCTTHWLQSESGYWWYKDRWDGHIYHIMV